MSGVDAVSILSGSETRVQLLRLLAAEGPLSRDELRRRTDVANVTLTRNLETLAEQGWIDEDARTYELTLRGEIIAERFFDLLETVEIVEHLEPFLEFAPRTGLDVDVAHLADADVTVGAKHNPFAPVSEYVDRLRDATEARILLTPVGLNALQSAREDLLADDAHYEIVLERAFLQSLRGDDGCIGVLEELAEADGSTVAVHDGELPFCLLVTETCAQLGVMDEFNHPRALVISDDDVVHEWALETFQKYRRAARPLLESGTA